MFNRITSSYSTLGYNIGASDLLAIVMDTPRETYLQATASQIKPQCIIAASSFDFNPEQSPSYEERLAGEGADPNTFAINTAIYHSSLRMPLYAPVTGWIDSAFAYLWNLSKYAYRGSSSAAIGYLINSDQSQTPVNMQSINICTDNIADFAPFSLPITVAIVPQKNVQEQIETVSIVGVNKRTRSLILASPTQYIHSVGSSIIYRPARLQDPDFSIMSYREGMLAPSLVNKIQLDVSATEDINVTVDFISLGLYRENQIDLRAYRQNLLKAFSFLPPKRIIEGNAVTLIPAPARTGAFGLLLPIGTPTFSGYQGLELDSVLITNATVVIDNGLEEIHTMHSFNNGAVRQFENSQPFLSFSNGRKISGSITYQSSIEPWELAERLSGPSSLANGGLKIDFGVFSISMPEVVWSISKSKGAASENQSRTLDWQLVSENYESMPTLDYSTQI